MMENKLVFGLLVLLLNAFGVPHFLKGDTKKGVIVLVLSLVTFGVMAAVNGIYGLIKGIQILTMSEEEYAASVKDMKLSIPA